MAERTKKSSVGRPKSGAKGDAASKKKRRLGRGLGSLLSAPVDVETGAARSTGNRASGSGVVPSPAAPALSSPGLEVTDRAVSGSVSPDMGGVTAGASSDPQVSMVPTDSVVPNAFQPREDFDESALRELAASIDRSGLMQPLVVRSTGNTGSWELVAGERRFRAMQSLGRAMVPVIALEVDDQAAAELALIENVHREDLNPIERARGLARLRDTFGLTQKALSERVGLDRSSVANLLRVLDLDDFSLAAVRRGTLSLGHAKALLSLTDPVVRRATAAAAVNGGWSVRELERRVRSLVQAKDLTDPKAEANSPITRRQANVVDLEKRLTEMLGLRVQIVLGRKKGTGKLQVSFETLEEFDHLTERLGLPGS